MKLSVYQRMVIQMCGHLWQLSGQDHLIHSVANQNAIHMRKPKYKQSQQSNPHLTWGESQEEFQRTAAKRGPDLWHGDQQCTAEVEIEEWTGFVCWDILDTWTWLGTCESGKLTKKNSEEQKTDQSCTMCCFPINPKDNQLKSHRQDLNYRN